MITCVNRCNFGHFLLLDILNALVIHITVVAVTHDNRGTIVNVLIISTRHKVKNQITV